MGLLGSSQFSHHRKIYFDFINVDVSSNFQLSEAMKEMKSRMNVDLELRDKSQKELEDDLTSAKHNLLEVRHQLNMAEKVRLCRVERNVGGQVG